MPYSDFTLTKLEKKFGITHQSKVLFEVLDAKMTLPSAHLLEDLYLASKMPAFSEKAKSELLIMPILKEFYKTHQDKSTIFSGYSFDIDAKNELNGVCDYLLSAFPNLLEIKSPVFCLVEAKNRSVEEGFGQCAAEMYAASLFNAENKQALTNIYGVVTNGYEWVFMKYETNSVINAVANAGANNVIIDQKRYFLSDVTSILHILDKIITEALTEVL